MGKTPRLQDALDDPSVRNLTKDVLRMAMDKDALDAYKDVQLAADILKARFDRLVAPTRQPGLSPRLGCAPCYFGRPCVAHN